MRGNSGKNLLKDGGAGSPKVGSPNVTESLDPSFEQKATPGEGNLSPNGNASSSNVTFNINNQLD